MHNPSKENNDRDSGPWTNRLGRVVNEKNDCRQLPTTTNKHPLAIQADTWGASEQTNPPDVAAPPFV